MTDFERLVVAYAGDLDSQLGIDTVAKVLRALDAIGYQAVPKVATEEMVAASADKLLDQYATHPEWDAAKDVIEDYDPTRQFTAMLAAAPKLEVLGI